MEASQQAGKQDVKNGRRAKIDGNQSPNNTRSGWRRYRSKSNWETRTPGSSIDLEKDSSPNMKWSLGILSDKKTEEVPGTLVLPTGVRHSILTVSRQGLYYCSLQTEMSPSVSHISLIVSRPRLSLPHIQAISDAIRHTPLLGRRKRREMERSCLTHNRMIR